MLSIHKPLGQTVLKKPRIITKAIFYLKIRCYNLG